MSFQWCSWGNAYRERNISSMNTSQPLWLALEWRSSYFAAAIIQQGIPSPHSQVKSRKLLQSKIFECFFLSMMIDEYTGAKSTFISLNAPLPNFFLYRPHFACWLRPLWLVHVQLARRTVFALQDDFLSNDVWSQLLFDNILRSLSCWARRWGCNGDLRLFPPTS